MVLKNDATLEGNLTYAFKNDMRNLANVHQSMFKSLKIQTLIHFTQSRKCISFKFTGEFRFKTMKNDAKIVKELTCLFTIDRRNLMNFDPSTQKSQKFALYWASFE